MTRSKPSQPKINAGETLGILYDRFRRQAGWNLEADETLEARNDREQFIAAGLEVLGAARIPPASYERLYRRAMVSRARRRANNESVNYKLSAEDLAVEWFVLEKETADAATGNEKRDLSSANCPNINNHVGNQAIVEYCFGGLVEVVLPCHACRPKSYEQKRAESVEEHNRSFASRRLETKSDDEIKNQEAINAQAKIIDFQKAAPTEEKLSLEEIAALEVEHNNLVKKFVEDADTRRRLSLYYDDHAECFRNPDFVNVTVSLEEMKRKIESYKKHLPPIEAERV